DAVGTEPRDVVEFLGQPPQVAGAVVVRVVESAGEDLVEHRGLEPVRVDGQAARMGEVLGPALDEMTVFGVFVIGYSVGRIRHGTSVLVASQDGLAPECPGGPISTPVPDGTLCECTCAPIDWRA